MVVYLSVCGNTLRRYNETGKGRFTCQCVVMLLAEMLQIRKGDLHINVGDTFPRFAENDSCKLGCQCVRTLLEGNPNKRASLHISV